jgi:hypothetical protein
MSCNIASQDGTPAPCRSGHAFAGYSPLTVVPMSDLWLVRRIPGLDGDLHVRRPIVGAGLRIDDEDRADWQFVVHAGSGFGLTFARDAHATHWWDTWVYRSGTRRCRCLAPSPDPSDVGWCQRCPGEVAA